ncbi:MAG: acetyl-CoA C-acetyltransferase [Acidobacteria bacterium]|nr:acetyl-CoA C-acetyltransferase [Acidobacteriota bacterium]
MSDVVIVSAVRTPVGRFQGGLKDLKATELGAKIIREAYERAKVDSSEINEVIMGNVLSAGLGQNPARQAALNAGIASSVSALTINKVCGSGLKSVMLAAQAIQCGDEEVVVAGGMESMTNAPYLLPKLRDGYRLGHGQALDVVIQDGLWCAFENWHMGNSGEWVAKEYNISREEQDEYALNSHKKAVIAQESGRFDDEILKIEIPQKKGAPLVIKIDESVRADASVESLAKLKPAFDPKGSVTAGNAPGINDGAAAVVVMNSKLAAGRDILGRIVGQAVGGTDPKKVMMAPVIAVQKLMQKTGWQVADVDLFELNEAFSVQAIAVCRELGLDLAKVNVNGGAVAIGHPIGASGARCLVTLLYEMKKRDAHRGVVSLCLGGGNAVAMAVER